jgi:hypothetical protein
VNIEATLPCTVDSADKDCRLSATQIGKICGVFWAMKPFVYKSVRAGKRAVQQYRSYQQINRIQKFIDKHEQAPKLRDVSPWLQRVCLEPGEPYIDWREFWSSLWAGPELAEIDAFPESREEFWTAFLDSARDAVAEARAKDGLKTFNPA